MTTIQINYNDLEKNFEAKAVIILRNIHNFLHSSKNYYNHGDQKWVKLTVKKFCAMKNIGRTSFFNHVSFLKKKGILITDKLAKNKKDNTNFYQINYSKLQEYGVKVTGMEYLVAYQNNIAMRLNGTSVTASIPKNIVKKQKKIEHFATEEIAIEPDTIEEIQNQPSEVFQIPGNPLDSLINDIACEFQIKKDAIKKYATQYSKDNIMNIIKYVREKTANMNDKAGYLIKALQNNWQSSEDKQKEKQAQEFEKQLQYIKRESAKSLHNLCNKKRNIEEETKIFLHLGINNENIIMGQSDGNTYCLVTSDLNTYTKTDTSGYKQQIKQDLPHIDLVVAILVEEHLLEDIEPISKYIKEENEKKLVLAQDMADKYLINIEKIIRCRMYYSYTLKDLQEVEKYISLKIGQGDIENIEKYIIDALIWRLVSSEKEESMREFHKSIRG